MSAASVISETCEYREIRGSWPKAIASMVDIRGHLGCQMFTVGRAISHAGDHLLGLCDCKD